MPDEDFLPMPKDLPSPAAVDGLLMSRRSVRAFTQKSVSKGTLDDLLEVARRAPTATNSQTLQWIVVNSAAKVHALSEIAVEGLRLAGVSQAVLEPWDKGYDFVLRGAPVVIAACTPAEYAWGKQDCSIALTFVELAAEARGLGVCWAGYLTRVAGLHEPLRAALSIPEGYVMQGGLMLGEPQHSYQRIPPRKLLSVQWI
jgi:nitroreductase